MKNSLLLLACLLLTGCAVMERLWLVPRSTVTISIPDHLEENEALSEFAEIAVIRMRWGKEVAVTFLDAKKGVVEIGHWRKSNVAGYSARAVVRDRRIRYVVKGVGPYYTKLPIEEVASKIRLELEKRMRSVTYFPNSS